MFKKIVLFAALLSIASAESQSLSLATNYNIKPEVLSIGLERVSFDDDNNIGLLIGYSDVKKGNAIRIEGAKDFLNYSFFSDLYTDSIDEKLYYGVVLKGGYERFKAKENSFIRWQNYPYIGIITGAFSILDTSVGQTMIGGAFGYSTALDRSDAHGTINASAWMSLGNFRMEYEVQKYLGEGFNSDTRRYFRIAYSYLSW